MRSPSDVSRGSAWRLNPRYSLFIRDEEQTAVLMDEIEPLVLVGQAAVSLLKYFVTHQVVRSVPEDLVDTLVQMAVDGIVVRQDRRDDRHMK